MKLSIILTVYNKADFLHRSFQALLSQECVSDGDYEVLVVNDGSEDDSSIIIEEYAKKDYRVRVLSQDNQGLSMARNTGIDMAKGDYVWFVDADDVISPKSVYMICNAINFRPDVISICSDTEGVPDIIRNKVSKDIKTGREMLLDPNWVVCSVLNILRRDFLIKNQLRF